MTVNNCQTRVVPEPQRGGDADVHFLGIAVLVRRIHHSSFDIHRHHNNKKK